MICEQEVKKYCKDFTKIENYDKAIADKTQTWCCHHRLEISPFSGKNISVRRLIELGLYYNVSPNALIFMPRSVHAMLHGIGNKGRIGKPHTEETKRKCSENNKGKHRWTEEMRRKQSEVNMGERNPRYGKHHSEEAKMRIAEARKGKHLSEDTKRKLSEINTGKHLSEETKKKISQAGKGKHWYNNGIIDKLFTTCPDGFVPGRLHHK